MPELYGRRWRVSVQASAGTALVVEGLRVQFAVHKAVSTDPSTLDLSIYNLSAESRHRLSSVKDPVVVVEAGYADSMAQLFAGNARTVSHKREGPSWATKVACGDHELAYQTDVVNQSFGAGQGLADAFRGMATSMSVDASQAMERLGKGDLSGGLGQFLNGVVLSGNAYGATDKLVRAADPELSWTIQDGKLLIWKGKETVPAGQGTLLSQTTGLIGSPEYAAPKKVDPTQPALKLLKAKSLLNPALRPLMLVRMESATVTGNFRVNKVTHRGDSHGSEWYSDLELEPL